MMESRQRDFLSVMGHLYLTSGKTEKAKTVYESLHSSFPEDAELALALAYTRLQCREFTPAIELIDRFFKPGKASAVEGPHYHRLIRAKALWNRGDKVEARREMQTFLATAPLREVTLTARRKEAAAAGKSLKTPQRA